MGQTGELRVITCLHIAGTVAACGVSDAVEVATGTNPVRDTVCGGNQDAYDITS